jgi:hypothetical protein
MFVVDSMNATDMDDMNVTADPCEVFTADFVEEKFWLVSVVGTMTALISLFNNSILLYIFMVEPQLRKTHFYYMVRAGGGHTHHRAVNR